MSKVSLKVKPISGDYDVLYKGTNIGYIICQRNGGYDPYTMDHRLLRRTSSLMDAKEQIMTHVDVRESYERIGIEKCPCGQAGCSKWFLTNVGRFVQGSGFDEEDAVRIRDLWNANLEG